MNVLDLSDSTKSHDHVADAVELKVGEELHLRVHDIPSSGYVWQLDDIADNLLFIGEGEYVRDNKDPEVVGSGGVQTFIIRAQADGAGILNLTRLRPWDPGQISCRCNVAISVIA